MAYGSEQGAAIQPVFYLVALADFVYFFQNSQLLELACPQILLAIFFNFFVKVHILYILSGRLVWDLSPDYKKCVMINVALYAQK